VLINSLTRSGAGRQKEDIVVLQVSLSGFLRDETSVVSMRRKGNLRVGAIILAAGKSTRMGEPKQLLLLGERTVLEQTLENVRCSGVDEIVLVLGSYAETVRQRLPPSAFTGAKLVVNQNYCQGMASSLREGLAALKPNVDASLIVLADQPFTRPETLRRIVDQYIHSDAQIVIPSYRGFRGNPVLLDRSVFAEVMALEGDIGCRAVFGSHLEGIVKVEVEDIGVLLDIDSKDDYEQVQRIGQSRQEDAELIEAATREAREIPGMKEPDAAMRTDELIVVGWEPVAAALVKLGQMFNFGVTVIDPLVESSALPEQVRLVNTLDFSLVPGTAERYVVVASRGKFDEDAVEQALHARSAYIGLVASSKRGREIRRSLERKGESAQMLATVQVPAGLDIGAETPEEIALSVFAEIISRRRAKMRNKASEARFSRR
jgi:molybdenum cofactor cytidylyltransferase